MIKRSASRNQRPKGVKVKHVLQIILLLGVCFWLIYQVKHSHDKKKEFDESDGKVSIGTQTAYQRPKLGRKDPHRGEDKVNQNEKHEQEEEDENIAEDEDKPEHIEHEEVNGHETEEKEDDRLGVKGGGEELEEDENKNEEMEDERGIGDDEIGENDQEKPEVDTDRDEEFMDEEREKEEEGDEKDKENSEDEEKEGSIENHNSHEAREEHYKGDDASSAVTHDTLTTSTETETMSLESSGVNSEKNIMKSENKPNYAEDSNRNQPSSDFKITNDTQLTGGTSSNETSVKETGNNSLSNPVDSSHVNDTAITYSDGHLEASSNLTVVIPEASNMTGTDISSEHTEMVNQARNDTMNTTVTGNVKNVQLEGLEQGENRFSEGNLPDSNLTVPVKTENEAAAGGESSNLEGGDIENTTRFVGSTETENKGNTEMSETNDTRNNSYVKENTDATRGEGFKGGTQISETSDSSSAHGTSDSSDSHILKEETEVRTDLDTLPGIRNEGDNDEAAAIE